MIETSRGRPKALWSLVSLAISCLNSAGVALGSPRTVRAEAPEDVCSRGSFSNPTYLYSIAVPEGLRCCTDPPPSPVHGCAITLPGKSGTNLWIDGSYSLDFNSSESALRYFVGRLLEAGTTLTVLRHAPARLGGFDAVRLILRISKPGAEPMIEDRVMAWAARKGRGEIIYLLWKRCSTLPKDRSRSLSVPMTGRATSSGAAAVRRARRRRRKAV